MIVSVNLMNPAHYDTNDIGCGTSIWMNKEQDKPTNLFVLPNLFLKDKHGHSRD